jgi:hypothetical protein
VRAGDAPERPPRLPPRRHRQAHVSTAVSSVLAPKVVVYTTVSGARTRVVAPVT